MVVIRDVKDTCDCVLCCYTEDGEELVIGTIKTLLELNDIRIQIIEELSGNYFIIYKDNATGNKRHISINKYGNLDCWPVEFFDTGDKQLDILINMNLK